MGIFGITEIFLPRRCLGRAWNIALARAAQRRPSAPRGIFCLLWAQRTYDRPDSPVGRIFRSVHGYAFGLGKDGGSRIQTAIDRERLVCC